MSHYPSLLKGLEFLTENAGNPRWSGHLFHKQYPDSISNFLGEALEFSTQTDTTRTTEEEKRQKHTIRTYYELFLNLEPNLILEQSNIFPQRRPLQLRKSPDRNNHIPQLEKNKEGKYISFEDHQADVHKEEARRIGFSTQFERLKSWVHSMMAQIGIHIFESARYEELNYTNTMIYANDQPDVSGQKVPSYYWVGHASNLIVIPPMAGQTRSLHILTDPVEGDLFPGVYPRHTKEGKLIKGEKDKRLPRVDVVLISHNHRDHVDIKTLEQLVDQQPKMIVPEGDKELFLSLGFKYVEELTWGEKAIITQEGQDALEITSVPARHWSGRGLHDAHQSAFAGYVIHSNATPNQDIYFAGDTAELGHESSKSIYEQFNICLDIQPGGPDENRSDMESTHQSSADGITAHFKNLLAHYQRFHATGDEISRKEHFLKAAGQIKMVYDHTATFKLGNLRLRDTYYSYNRVLAVFRKSFSDEQAQQFLAAHEFKAYQNIKILAEQIRFNDTGLNVQEIADLIERDIIVPKIGQRIDLNETFGTSQFNDRNLILNYRALESCDNLAMECLEAQTSNAKKSTSELIDYLILGLLNSYKEVWHAKWTRNHILLFDGIVMDENLTIQEKLDRLQANLTYKERYGHLQNIIHYAQWLKNTVKIPYDLEDYLARLHIRQLVDQQTKIAGLFFIPIKRDEKIKRFTELAEKLDKAESMAEYRSIFQIWLGENKTFMCENRSVLFSQKKTRSEQAIDEINEAMNKGKGFPDFRGKKHHLI